MIVLDASALTDFLLGHGRAIDAVGANIESENEFLHAPELIEPETLNALRKLVLAKALTERRATEAVTDLEDLRLIRYPHAPLRERVWQLRDNLTAYDATYLALAEALAPAALVTADRGLAAQARRLIGRERVIFLS